MHRDVYICYIDYVKAFDKVQHKQLFRILKGLGVNGKDLELIKNLYWKQEATIKIGNHSSDWVKIEKGVRKGYVLSPDLFSFYTESIMNSIAHKEDIIIGGMNINNVKYANDTAIIAETADQLQNIMDVVTTESKKAGLEVNQKKFFTQVFFKKKGIAKCSIKVDGAIIKRVDNFSYYSKQC